MGLGERQCPGSQAQMFVHQAQERTNVEGHGNMVMAGRGGGQGFVRHVGESRVFPIGAGSLAKFENGWVWNWRENPWGGLP